jgi:antitoxin VapB
MLVSSVPSRPSSRPKSARLFRNGANQAIRIPREWELPGESVLIYKQGQYLIIEAAPKPSLLDVLSDLTPSGEAIPEFEELPYEKIGF